MTTFLLVFAFFSLVVLAMSVGVLMGKEPIKGSCGGLQNLGMKGECEICGGDLSRCEENQKQDVAGHSSSASSQSPLAYDAMKQNSGSPR